MTCEKQSDKKYVIRKSPSYPANSCPGQTKVGNDGHKYVSKAGAKGIYRWVKVSSKSGSMSRSKTVRKVKTASMNSCSSCSGCKKTDRQIDR